jgi:ribonuclease P protein component
LQTKRNPISLTAPHGWSLAARDQAERPGRGQERFRKQEHLKKRVDITRVFKKGRAVSCSGIKLFFLVNQFPCNRIVITFARKYGNAVQRNRTRRLGREAYRLMKSSIKTGYDMVFLIYPRAEGDSSKRGTQRTLGNQCPLNTLAEMDGQFKTLFKKAGIIRQKGQRSEEQ